MSRLTSKWNIIMDKNPKSPISEGYRILRTNLEFSLIDDKLQVIMVTSSTAGEGKSTTCANLAIAFAQAGKRVLLIDADMRKPTQHHIFSVSNRKGLTTILFHQQELQDAIQHTDIDNLTVVAAGPTPPNPSELLQSKRMESLLAALRDLYDVIIIDTPPIMLVTDAQLVASQSDGAVLVIDSGRVKRDAALKAKSYLEVVKAKIIGVVLNNIPVKDNDSYYYYYGESKEG
ncbi:CpsD/CapB family tyrosine-protein kinase [Paenibacillus protaetiae]|uniref:non-specific protein-tyrosine kinase n=1 Tax=Paenibacillus protaetiae TaxID=2509456 RepID=A0A4P6EWV3_9BACL|nr:CpsD/CapB family tyrosine-protein kinase [Paenibacillus protaetiae]QAY67216.1 polysaccharide biosynthesis tyrosine autokinase [Paenibacillus protaetiae]